MKMPFSRQTFAQSLRQCTERFPAPAGFITALSLWLLVQCWWDGLIPDRLSTTGTYYLSVGSLLSLVLRLWGEEARNPRTVLAANVAGHATLVADAMYLYGLAEKAIGMETILMHASLVVALALGTCILPFLRDKDDAASWNFCVKLFLRLASSWFVGLLMFAGLSLLTASLSELFDLSTHACWYPTWGIACCLFLPALLFLGRIPSGAEKHAPATAIPPFLRKSIHYLFLPLLGCYLLVLYAYLAKILVQWELPDGWVSGLVTALMGGCIAMELTLYPLLRQGGTRLEHRISRWLPIAILPLLVLMTIGIARRIGDYGYTVNRLYLLALNIWFYFVCAGLALSRKRIRWIPASFAAAFLLTSVFPWNFTSLSRRHLRQSIEETFRSSCRMPLPLCQENYLDWLATLPKQEALNVNDRLRYLRETLGDSCIHAYVGKDVRFHAARQFVQNTLTDSSSQGEGGKTQAAQKEKEGTTYIDFEARGAYSLPLKEGYRAIRSYHGQACLARPLPEEKGWWEIVPTDSVAAQDTVYVQMAELHKWNALEEFTPRELPCRRKGDRFVLTGTSLLHTPADSILRISLSGYYLMK